MEVAPLHNFICNVHYVGIWFIGKCFPRGFWEGFQVLHDSYIIVKLVTINYRFIEYIISCEMPNLITMRKSVGYYILWSRYKV